MIAPIILPDKAPIGAPKIAANNMRIGMVKGPISESGALSSHVDINHHNVSKGAATKPAIAPEQPVKMPSQPKVRDSV